MTTNNKLFTRNRGSSVKSPQRLMAEYQDRQRSKRPLPSSVAKAYEVLIARSQSGDAQIS